MTAPLTRLERLRRKAQRTNRRRDVSDALFGFAAPSRSPDEVWLKTITSALEAGIGREDWDCVAEGLVMLEDFIGAHYGD